MERYLREQEPQIKNEPFDFVESVGIIHDSWIKSEIKEEDLFQVRPFLKSSAATIWLGHVCMS